jgi:hypothetical protein
VTPASFARFTDGIGDGRNLLKLLWREIMGRLDGDISSLDVECGTTSITPHCTTRGQHATKLEWASKQNHTPGAVAVTW